MLSFRAVKYRNDFFQYPCFKLAQRFKCHSCLSFQEQPLYYKNSAIPDSTIVKIAFFIIIYFSVVSYLSLLPVHLLLMKARSRHTVLKLKKESTL